MSLDPRLTLARGDLAAAELEGLVPARTYRATTAMHASRPEASIRRAPRDDAEQVDQLLFGEGFEALIDEDGWVFGQARRDGYVGYVAAAELAPAGPPPTHRIAALRTYGFARPDLKAPTLGAYPLNGLVAEAERQGRFVRDAGGGWFPAEHLRPVGAGFEEDPAGVAERFLGAPYLWGGRGALGVDCSGLVQQALLACGRACPRDTDMQAAFFPAVEPAALDRGDLVFWPGHVAMMLDETRIIHANAFHMATAIEMLETAAARIGPPSGYRRP